MPRGRSPLFGRGGRRRRRKQTNSQHDLGTIAKLIVDSNLYMTLATADENGRLWASPVYYAHEGYARFYWVSSPEATHSRNIASRPEIAIVIFDSQAPIGAA